MRSSKILPQTKHAKGHSTLPQLISRLDDGNSVLTFRYDWGFNQRRHMRCSNGRLGWVSHGSVQLGGSVRQPGICGRTAESPHEYLPISFGHYPNRHPRMCGAYTLWWKAMNLAILCWEDAGQIFRTITKRTLAPDSWEWYSIRSDSSRLAPRTKSDPKQQNQLPGGKPKQCEQLEQWRLPDANIFGPFQPGIPALLSKKANRVNMKFQKNFENPRRLLSAPPTAMKS